jgi:hypothetical protein
LLGANDPEATGGKKMALQSKSKKVGDVIVTICLTEDEGLSVKDGGKWLLMCETHGRIAQDTNYARLWSNADEVADWCEECQQAKVGA